MAKILVVCGGAGRGLIGQRSALGFDAEVQIDVQQEIVPHTGDQRSFRIDLSSEVPLHRGLLQDLWKTAQAGNDDALKAQADVLHKGFQAQTSLVPGLMQRPAIGGAVVRYPGNEQKLRITAQRIKAAIAANPGPTVDVWIVSSTAGGTGAGIRRFVGRVFAEELATIGVSVKLRFLLYGAKSYSSIAPDRTARNTFMGVLQDAAFLAQPIEVRAGNPPECSFYYLEIQDTGDDKKRREELVVITARALWADALEKDLEAAAVNVNCHTALVKVGYWDGQLPAEQLYHEVLLQLRDKLTQLTKPRPEQFTRGYTCKAESESLAQAMESITPELMLRSQDWQFPKASSFLGIKKKDESAYVEECKQALSELLKRADQDIRQVGVSFEPQPDDPADAERAFLGRPLRLSSPDAGLGWPERIAAIRDAHRIDAWCNQLLPGLSAQQLALAQEASAIQHRRGAGSEARAKELAPKVKAFLDVTTRLSELQRLKDGATELLSTLQEPFVKVLDRVNEEETRVAKQAGVIHQEQLVLAAELSDRVVMNDARSWIELLHQAATSKDRNRFKDLVEKGATGLTAAGLQRVLETDSNDIDAMRQEMMNHVGRMRVGPVQIGGEVEQAMEQHSSRERTEGIWWQGKENLEAGAFQRYSYRLFPHLDFETGLKDPRKTGAIKFLPVPIAFLGGLRVLAVEMINLPPQNDLYATAAKLAEGVQAEMAKVLETGWEEDASGKLVAQAKGVTTNVLEVAEAGVGGEPIAGQVLDRLRAWPAQYTERLRKLFNVV